jgi:hypothetical protein
MNWLALILSLLVVFVGCESVPEPNPDNGKLCSDGAKLFESLLLSEGADKEAEAIKKHCQTCVDCRKAFYTPDRWKELE